MSLNIITIVALLVALTHVLSDPREPVGLMLQEVTAGTDLVDESLLSDIRENVDIRAQLTNVTAIVMIVAILSNIAANYLGRQRQKENAARIRELEARLGEK